MFSETIKQLALVFATNIAEVVEAEMRAKMTSALSALGVDGDSDSSSPTRAARKAVKKTSAKSKSSKSEGRLARRSPEEIAAVVADAAKLLSKHPDGLRSEEIRTTLDLDVREVPRVLKDGIASGALKVLSGHKRSTRYGIGKGGKGGKATSKKVAKKAKAAPKAKKAKARKSAKKTAKKVSKSANGAARHATAAAEAAA